MNQSELIEKDIEHYLKQHENKQLLRFLTCGSVDDGKSTLIGRLLHDSKMIFEDQLAAIKKDSKKFNSTNDEFDLALLVDGLQSEREQGITIDVAYRYFSTDKRKFIIADTPGHEQYTRNMATGASNCELAIVMVDARRGVQVQTKRHSFIASLLGIRQIIVAVNKMDLVDFSESVFHRIRDEYLTFAEKLNFSNVQFVPISALRGDNVVECSDLSPWYQGDTLMTMLETADIGEHHNRTDFRLPVQYVNRPSHVFRGYCGTIAGGVVRKNDEVTVLPSGKRTRVRQVFGLDGELNEAQAPMAVTLTLQDEIDISRGDVLVHGNNPCLVSDNLEATIVWMSEAPMIANHQYDFKVGKRTAAGCITRILHKVDVNTLDTSDSVRLGLNDIGHCQVHLNQDVVFDAYADLKQTGSFIVIDRLSNATVGAGMIAAPAHQAKKTVDQNFSEFELELNALVRKHFPHWGAVDLKDLLSKA